MAATAKELKEWITTIDDNDLIAIDEGGLSLVSYGPNASLEERVNADSDPNTCEAWFEIGDVNIEDE